MAGSDSMSFKITYMTKYGSAPADSGYFDLSTELTASELPELSYPYGKFLGWYSTETFDEDTKAEVGDTAGYNGGNFDHYYSGSTLTLYAKWESEQHLINAMDLQNIADAIREYTGTTAGLKPSEWASTFAEGGVSKITFTVSGTSYQAEEGMTWAEWVDSEYNTGGFIVQYSMITKEGDYKNIHTSYSYSTVSAADAIIENHTYYYEYFTPRPDIPEV